MNVRMLKKIGRAVLAAGGLALACGPALAQEKPPMTPELAAKKQMVTRQEAQRITPEQRKAAAAALKQQRLKVHEARKKYTIPPPGEAGK